MMQIMHESSSCQPPNHGKSIEPTSHHGAVVVKTEARMVVMSVMMSITFVLAWNAVISNTT